MLDVYQVQFSYGWWFFENPRIQKILILRFELNFIWNGSMGLEKTFKISATTYKIGADSVQDQFVLSEKSSLSTRYNKIKLPCKYFICSDDKNKDSEKYD